MATLVVPEPPIFKVAIFLGPLNLVVPGRFRHLTKGVQGLPRFRLRQPGVPQPINPPLALTGSLLPNSITPSSMACHDWPGVGPDRNDRWPYTRRW